MRRFSDERMEALMGGLLRTGVLCSVALVFAGAILYLAGHVREAPDFRTFHGEPTAFRHLYGIARAALALRGRGLIQLGLLVLVATPVARVVFSVFAFLAQGDWTYVGVTLLVLSILLFCLFGVRP
jgi:uncharacterized membrane protein